MMIFVVALSLMVSFFGSAHQNTVALLLSAMVTTASIAACGSCRLPWRRNCSIYARKSRRPTRPDDALKRRPRFRLVTPSDSPR